MNMIEKVARSLATIAYRRAHETDEKFVSSLYPHGETEFVDKRFAFYVDDAKAAIEALREPSSWMLNEAVQISEDQASNVSGYEYWQRMIDAALKEPIP